jgi:hypothetical protein
LPKINIITSTPGLGEEEREVCRKDPSDPLYSDRMKGCFDQFQKSIANNKDVIGIVTVTVIAFLVRLNTNFDLIMTMSA